jgi:hypothetical protein
VLDVLRDVSGGTIVDLDRPVSGPAQFQVDMTTMSRITRWKPEVSIEDGIRRTYEFTKRLVSEAATARQDGQ